METAPNPPPRGGAEPRVSAETFDAICEFAQREHAKSEATTMQMIALDARDLRAKLEAAEARAHKAEQDQARFSVNANARLSEAEAALRDMTEQRDGAWEAGALAMRDAAANLVDDKCRLALEHGWIVDAAKAIRALAPPAETAAKEEH